MTEKINAFDVIKHLADSNSPDLILLPLSNIISVDLSGKNCYIKIGAPIEFFHRYMNENFTKGGFLFITEKAFKEAEEKLKQNG